MFRIHGFKLKESIVSSKATNTNLLLRFTEALIREVCVVWMFVRISLNSSHFLLLDVNLHLKLKESKLFLVGYTRCTHFRHVTALRRGYGCFIWLRLCKRIV